MQKNQYFTSTTLIEQNHKNSAMENSPIIISTFRCIMDSMKCISLYTRLATEAKVDHGFPAAK